jgi:hypothetical protein
MTALFEVIAVRDLLMRELNAGLWDGESWDALYIMARDNGCSEIARQVMRYIEHYGDGA